jgi:GWxTD domain-containing protein
MAQMRRREAGGEKTAMTKTIRRGAPLARLLVRGVLLLGAMGGIAAGAIQLPTAAQSVERPAFRARTVPFTDGDSTAIAIQIELPYDALCFPRAGDGWVAHFDLIATAWRHDRQIAGNVWRDSIRVAQRGELRGRRARYVRDCVLPLPPGEYEIEVTLSEPQCGQEGRLRVAAIIPADLEGQAHLSPILLGPCGLAGSLRDLLGDRRVRLDFADPAESVCAYVDLSHRGLTGDSIRVRWRLAEAEGGTVRLEGRAAFAPDTALTRLTWLVPLAGLGMDSFRLGVTATLGGAQAEASVVFGARIETELTLGPFFQDDLDVLLYIATDAAVNELRNAAPDERAARWAEFWKPRDPTPGTEENEFKDEFFRRMRHADREFSGAGPGWRTDRGRIYILNGEPDSIERDPMPSGGFPVEVWIYDSLGLRFVFVDRTGFGDFRLVSGPG